MAKPAFDQCGEEVGRRKEGRPALSQFSAQSKRKGFMRLRWFIGFAALAAAAQTSQKNPAADWPMYNRDLAGTRFSPLNQINTLKRRTADEGLDIQGRQSQSRGNHGRH